MRHGVSRDRVREAPAEEVQRALGVGDECHDRVKFRRRHMPEGLQDVFADGGREAGVGARLAPALRRRCLGERRFQLRLNLLTQPPLELGICGKAEPAGKAKDGGRAHAAPSGELGNRLEPDHRIVGQERPCGAALGGGQFAQPIAHDLGDGWTAAHILHPAKS